MLTRFKIWNGRVQNHLFAGIEASVRSSAVGFGFCLDPSRAALLLLSGVLSTLPAQAIDFKIDVPEFRDELLVPALADYSLPKGLPESPLSAGKSDFNDSALGSARSGSLPFSIPEPPAGLVMPPEPREGGDAGKSIAARAQGRESQDAFYETSAFPVPQCLEDNVNFWGRIYSEVRTEEALIHDRENMDRVFAKLKLPVPRKARARAMRSAREHFEMKLNVLAEKVEKRVRLTRDERELLSSFRVEDRTAQQIRASAKNLRIQSGLKQRFSAGVQRSLKYMGTITPILRKYDVPKDIVHLPHVESSYIRTARSKVGAVGLWQIMPSTMRHLMGRNAVHKRTHLQTSTHAAAKLLQQNYRMLKSWPLALTAYNHGASGVRRGVRATGSTDLCTIIANYRSRSFKFASSNFYAQFLAARHVALNEYRTLSEVKAHKRVLQPLLAYARKERL